MNICEYEKILLEQTVNLSSQNRNNKYTNVNLDELEYIKNHIGLTVSEKEFLFDIMNYISVGTNFIINKDGTILKHSEIASLLKIDIRSLTRKFKSLIEKKIVHCVKDWNKSNYIINPYLFNCSFVLDQTFELFNLLGYKQDTYEKVVKIKDKTFAITKEKILETLISNDLEQIEEGLTLIKTQYEVNNGFIDILAKDKNEVITIIEVKIKNDDPKLIEQCVYYPTQFNEKTRLITIAPSYTIKLYDTLTSLGNIEIKNYSIKENNLIIKDFKHIV